MVKKLLLFLPFLLLTSVNANKFCFYDNFNLFCNEDGKYQQSFSQLIIKPKIIESSSSLSSSSIISDSLSSSSENNEPQTLTCPDYYTYGSGKKNRCYVNPIYDHINNTCTYSPKEIPSSEDPCKIGTCDPDTGEIVYKNNPVYCFVPEDKNDIVPVDNDRDVVNVKIEFNETEPCKNVNNTCVAALYNTTCTSYNDNYECEWSWSDKECKCVKKQVDLKSVCKGEYIIDINNYKNSIYVLRTTNTSNYCQETKLYLKSDIGCMARWCNNDENSICFDSLYHPMNCPNLKSKIYDYTIPNSEYKVKVFVSYSNITECVNNPNKICTQATFTAHCNSLDPSYVCHPMSKNESNYNPEYPCSCDLINVIEDCPTYIDEDYEINLCYTSIIDNGICRYTYKESYEKNGLIFACNPETGKYENISATTTITLTPGYLVSKNTSIKTRDIRDFMNKENIGQNKQSIIKFSMKDRTPMKFMKYLKKQDEIIKIQQKNNLPDFNPEQKIRKIEYEIYDSVNVVENVINDTTDRIDAEQLLVTYFNTIIEQYINDTFKQFIDDITNSSGSLEYNNETYNEILNNIVEFINNVTNISLSELEQANNLTKRQMEIIKDQINDLEDNLKQLFRRPIYESILEVALLYVVEMKKLQDNTATEISQELNVVEKLVIEMDDELQQAKVVQGFVETPQTGTDVKPAEEQIGTNITGTGKDKDQIDKAVDKIQAVQYTVKKTTNDISMCLGSMKKTTMNANGEYSRLSYELASRIKEGVKLYQSIVDAIERVDTSEVYENASVGEDGIPGIEVVSRSKTFKPVTTRRIVREYTKIPEYNNVKLWIMYINNKYECQLSIISSDDSIACFKYEGKHYCINKELIHYTYINGKLTAIIYYEDLNIDYVTPQCPITFVGIE